MCDSDTSLVKGRMLFFTAGQWFSAGDHSPSLRRCWIFGFRVVIHKKGGMNSVSRGRDAKQPTARRENHPAQNVSSVKTENPWYREPENGHRAVSKVPCVIVSAAEVCKNAQPVSASESF